MNFENVWFRIVPLLVPSFIMNCARANFLETFPAAAVILENRKLQLELIIFKGFKLYAKESQPQLWNHRVRRWIPSIIKVLVCSEFHFVFYQMQSANSFLLNRDSWYTHYIIVDWSSFFLLLALMLKVHLLVISFRLEM